MLGYKHFLLVCVFIFFNALPSSGFNFLHFVLQTKKARSVLGLVRGPDPGGGGPDLARGTGEDGSADRLVVVCEGSDNSFHVLLQALQEPIEETLDLKKQEAFEKPAAKTYPLS